MIIGIPVTEKNRYDSAVGEHFGRVPYFAIVDTENDEIVLTENTSHHKGGRGYPPELLRKNNVDVMVCKNLGRRAVSMFENFGIEVYIGATGTVRDALESFTDNQLQEATDKNACKEHKYHDR
ncbi:MAG: NifB/NifX family molybdenum-iron cluster-binding protein [Euryarchaeota archaeon]|nr:NifB/NifX family molybdenum-iron cluster-binding protein [Euryarchaeota archaeon]